MGEALLQIHSLVSSVLSILCLGPKPRPRLPSFPLLLRSPTVLSRSGYPLSHPTFHFLSLPRRLTIPLEHFLNSTEHNVVVRISHSFDPFDVEGEPGWELAVLEGVASDDRAGMGD